MPLAQFAEFRPDEATFDSPFTAEAMNVYPIDGGYGPVKGMDYRLGRLPEGVLPRGIVEFTYNNFMYRFLGSQNRLYLSTGHDFEIVSGPDAPYSMDETGRWGFTQYGSYCIATNGFDKPQKFVMGTGTEFEPLGGNPDPFVRTVVHKDFLHGYVNELDGTLTVWNSGIGNPEVYDGSLLSDAQPIPEGGAGTAIVAGECVLVFQKNRIHRFIFSGDPNAPYQRDEIQTGRGCVGPDAAAVSGSDVFFLAEDGFYRMTFSGQVTPIGAGAVNRWFFQRVGGHNVALTMARSDPSETRVYFRYRSDASTDGVYDGELGYDWRLGRWYRISGLDAYDVFDTTIQDWSIEDIGEEFGSIDNPEIGSLDDQIYRGGDVRRVFVDVHGQMRVLGGANRLPAVLETAPLLSPSDVRKQVTETFAVTDATVMRMQVGTQERLFDHPSWSPEKPANFRGYAQWNRPGRTVRARLLIPKKAEWTRAQAIDVTMRPLGKR